MSPARDSLPRLLPRPLGEEERRPEVTPSRRRKLCDSARPQCRQCARRNWPCVYTAPPGVTSQQLKKERTENYASVVELIRRGDGVHAEQIAQRIREAESVDTAVGDIASASLLLQTSSRAVKAATGPPLRQYPAAASRPLLTSPYEDCDFVFEKRYDTDAYYRRVDPSLFVDVSGHDLPLSNWTKVSTDNRRMNHLLNLFFTWDNVVERIIYRPILEENARRLRRGHQGDYDDNTDSDFCSPFLINALLALSCLYSMDPATYKDPADPKTRGRLWAEEARLHLQNCTRPSIALMQGLYVMLIYEASLSDGARTLQYLTQCMDVYRILNDGNMNELADDTVPESRRKLEREAFSWCMWGMYCTEW
ncbi:Nitrogen assimilation transcription factor nit-4 [Beauveria bassiana]|uniref:Nitrogen assimilation transcription factor nit-4 n=1 Tax=Beauveria bassiana TaxID=176275 RepID=A0A2N6NNI3_BEABA|nr:Nitrogen assimilation transcription factor nit-4 [Beauveria bassiana]